MTTARERIIGAALTLVAERGLADVSMVAVAHEAGVARATLYNHYPDVPSVLADAARIHDQHAIDGLRQALAVVAGPHEVVEQLVRHVAAISTHGHTLSTRLSFPPDLRDQLGSFDRELDHQVRDALIDGAASGAFRSDLDPAIATSLVRHVLHGVSELVASTPERAADIVDDAVTMLRAALEPPAGAAPAG